MDKTWMMSPGPDSVMRSTEQKNTPRTKRPEPPKVWGHRLGNPSPRIRHLAYTGMGYVADAPLTVEALRCGGAQEGHNARARHVLTSCPSYFPGPLLHPSLGAGAPMVSIPRPGERGCGGLYVALLATIL